MLEAINSKILIVVRHARAVSTFEAFPDFERPLTDRGRREARQMATGLQKRLVALSLQPNLILASPALRTKETAEIFLETLQLEKELLQFEPTLYLPQPSSFYSAIQQVPNSVNVLLVFSHNNGITDFVNQLTTVRVDVIPPCGIAAVAIQTNSWSQVEESEKRWLFFDYPVVGA